MEQQKPFPIPVNYFSIVLGLAALGLAWRYGAHTVALPAWVGETLLGLAAIIWLIFITAYGVKWWRNRFIGEATYRLRCVAIIVLNSFTALDFPKWFHRFILGILVWTGIHGKRGIAFIPRYGRYAA